MGCAGRAGHGIQTNLGACQNNLARNEDKQHHLRLDHTIDETWKELWFVGGVNTVAVR